MKNSQTTIRNKKIQFIDRSTYPSDPKQRNRLKAMSTWDAMKEVAKEEARKGNYKDLRELRKIERNAMKKKNQDHSNRHF